MARKKRKPKINKSQAIRDFVTDNPSTGPTEAAGRVPQRNPHSSTLQTARTVESHHAFPTSARHGLRWWQIDASYWVIRALAALRLAWNVRLPTKESQAQKRRTS